MFLFWLLYSRLPKYYFIIQDNTNVLIFFYIFNWKEIERYLQYDLYSCVYVSYIRYAITVSIIYHVYISLCYVRDKGKLPHIHGCLIKTSKSMDMGPNQDKTSRVSF